MLTSLLTILAGDLLTVDFSLLIVIAIFIVLIYALDAIIFQPITKVLDERDRLTSGSVDEAKKWAHDYDKQLAQYEEKIRAARAENYQMLENKRKAALDERTKKLSEERQQVSEKIEASKKELLATSSQIKSTLESDSLQIAKSIASNLLKRPLGGAF
ncbi:MAG: F-type H+-transporting ATPase subunit b [bacterium]|nr:MAG: F-type H+-transporting ATPase subunit b [bacterium]